MRLYSSVGGASSVVVCLVTETNGCIFLEKGDVVEMVFEERWNIVKVYIDEHVQMGMKRKVKMGKEGNVEEKNNGKTWAVF